MHSSVAGVCVCSRTGIQSQMCINECFDARVCILPISYSVVTEHEQEANPRYRFMEAQIYSFVQAKRKSLSRLAKVQRGPFKSYIVLCQSQANLRLQSCNRT